MIFREISHLQSMLPDSNYNTDQLRIQPVVPLRCTLLLWGNKYIIALDKFAFFCYNDYISYFSV